MVRRLSETLGIPQKQTEVNSWGKIFIYDRISLKNGEAIPFFAERRDKAIPRQAPGNAPIELLSGKGKDMSRGTPIERATADAFKNAAEAFGVARYLDDQKLTASLMQKQGDLRAYKYAKENEEIEVGARGTAINQEVKTITEPQVKRFWAIARKDYKLSDDDVKQVLSKFGLESTRAIPSTLYDAVITELGNFSPVNF